MFESCGGNFQEGSSQGNGFQLIKEYFQQRSCKHCCRNYSSDGIELIREEAGMVVVRVSCSSCGQPLGIALVGMTGGASRQTAPLAATRSARTLPPLELDIPYPADWSKNDIQRLSSAPQISYDDVLDAHEFFSGLGSDWSRFLPKKTKRAGAKPISA
ncbi:MAG: hypothetical protein K2X27_18180 [Candidatus Obscuribacterales bacterium]|nr:hypothetical protein [Candidatus Obscuribacterales bacterium]